MRYAYIHNYCPVLDRTVWSSPAFSGTGPDCGPRVLDYTVRSFYRSPFSSDKKTGLNGLVQYFWDRTAVRRYWTVRSSLFKWSLKKATVQTGPDRGQSSSESPAGQHDDDEHGFEPTNMSTNNINSEVGYGLPGGLRYVPSRLAHGWFLWPAGGVLETKT